MTNWIKKLDEKLERIEARLAARMRESSQTLRRVGHCAYCGEWCRGSLEDGFIHDSGEVSCENIEAEAIPRQVFLEQRAREAKDYLGRLYND